MRKTDRLPAASRGKSTASDVVRRLLRNKTAMAGLVILLIMTAACMLADVIAPYGYDEQDVMIKFLAPCREHIFGTDNLGRDIFSRILYGGRLTLLVGFAATGLAAVIGIILGAVSGFYGGRIDNIIMRILDIFMAVPNLVLAIALAAVLGNGMTSCMLAVGISAIPTFARTIRGPILTVKSQEYIEAARSIDASDGRTDPVPARAGQRFVAGHCAAYAADRLGHHKRCGTELFGPWRPAAEPGMGRDALGSAGVYSEIPAAVRVARHVDRNGRSVAESVWRRPA